MGCDLIVISLVSYILSHFNGYLHIQVHLLLFQRLGGWVWKVKLMLSQPNLAEVGVGQSLAILGIRFFFIIFSAPNLKDSKNLSEPTYMDQPKSTGINPKQPESTQINRNQPKSIRINSNQPESTRINPNQPESTSITPNTQINRNYPDCPGSTLINPDQPVSIRIKLYQPVSTPTKPYQPISASHYIQDTVFIK